MWFSKKKYNQKEVEYIVTAILRETVDRHTLRKIIEEKLSEIIGPRCVGQCFEKLNEIEEEADPAQVKFWMDKIEELRKTGAF
jgi:hypothetical protein